jgi:cytochrome c5
MRSRRLIGALGALALGPSLLLGCASPHSAPSSARDPLPYLDDAAYRRAELEASLVNPANAYSALRLSHYATGASSDWDALPEWNPAVEPIAATELDAPGGASVAFASSPRALALPDVVLSEDDPALLALGRAAFARYPLQLAPYMSEALLSRDAAARFGAWADATRGVGGLVRARMADGSPLLSLTCASCHAAPTVNGVEDGLPNAALDLGAAIVGAPSFAGDAVTAAAIAAWGPGRLDVESPSGTYPARIPDLRPVRFLTYLQQEGTVQQRDLTSLAIRIETLVVTSQGQVLRPPRVIALALAAYVASLGSALPSAEEAAAVSPRGAQLFGSYCASCHAAPGLTGPPVALAVVGTDPWLGESPDRGTGAYRVPSLHGVGSRGPLLHDGTVGSLEALLDPTRPTASFVGRLHGPGAVPGHLYGLDLPAADRAYLVAYLKAL